MSHKAVITDEIELENAMRIEFEVTIDGSKVDADNLDGEVIQGHFDMDYKKYKDNERVDNHLKMWAEHFIEKKVHEENPSDSAKGRQVEI